MLSSRRPIVVVGSINLDLVATTECIPRGGETVMGTQFLTHSGGKGGNQAVAIGRLSYPVRMIGRVGTDSFSRRLLSDLSCAGVDVDAVSHSEGSSGVALISVSESGENAIVVVPGANAFLSPDDIDANLSVLRSAGMVLVQLEIPHQTVEHLLKVCKRESIPVILDPAPAADLPSDVLKAVSWFTPNESEVSFYIAEKKSGMQAPSSSVIAQSLLSTGPQGVVLKLGKRGVYLATSEGLGFDVGGFQVSAVDTTAAGDAFNGAFAVSLMSGRSPLESAQFAAAAAAVSVTRAGAQTSMATMAEVEKLLTSGVRVL